MKLSECLDYLGCNLVKVLNHGEKEISQALCDSRIVGKDDIFVAIQGQQQNGEEYIPQALSRACSVIVSESSQEWPESISIQVESSSLALAQLAEFQAGRPAASMDLIGITGTNGKSSVAMIIDWLFRKSEIRSGLIGTIEVSYGDQKRKATMTTPDAVSLQNIFLEMKNAAVSTVTIEVSSHGLSQSRLGTVPVQTAVFTNLTQDHLDYHDDMAGYFSEKRKLFTDYLAVDGCAVVNIDDAYGRELIASTNSECLSVGFSEDADYRLENISYSFSGTSFDLIGPKQKYLIKSPLIGSFNVNNLALALVVVEQHGVPIEKSQKFVKNFPGVPGRLELFVGEDGRRVVVDYAHTPDALEKVLLCLKPLASKIHCLFGCGGDRDKGKRAQMGKLASDLADTVWLTDDNPRKENSEAILQDILSGIDDSSEVFVEANRRRCIEQALVSVKADEILLIAGKGHEDYQIYGTERTPFCDRATVREILGMSQC
jgi:UDP-N-acetylmuramoyl-L-alanyl-D-glutamate--2,6-diaminopimelate ligase